jgi:hypothetical protein
MKAVLCRRQGVQEKQLVFSNLKSHTHCEHRDVGPRKENPFFLQDDKMRKSPHFPQRAKGPDPFSEIRQQQVNLEQRGNN